MKVRFQIEGAKELNRRLAEFKKSTATGVLNRALKAAAKPIAVRAEELAPKLTGALKGSIGIAVVKSNAGKSAYAAAMQAGLTKADAALAAREANRAAAGAGAKAAVLVGSDLWRAHLTEFGTLKAPAQPFLGPALRAGEKQARATIAAELRKEIEKTAKRIARRKAKTK